VQSSNLTEGQREETNSASSLTTAATSSQDIGGVTGLLPLLFEETILMDTKRVDEELSQYILRDKSTEKKMESFSSDLNTVLQIRLMPHFPLARSLLLSSLQTGVPFVDFEEQQQSTTSEVNSNESSSTLNHSLHFRPLLEYLIETYAANGNLKKWNEMALRLQKEVKDYDFSI
jgi:hypothetical protein